MMRMSMTSPFVTAAHAPPRSFRIGWIARKLTLQKPAARRAQIMDNSSRWRYGQEQRRLRR